MFRLLFIFRYIKVIMRMGLLTEEFELNRVIKNKILNFMYNHVTYGHDWFRPWMKAGYEVLLLNIDDIEDLDTYCLNYHIDFSRKIIIVKTTSICDTPYDPNLNIIYDEDYSPISIKKMISGSI